MRYGSVDGIVLETTSLAAPSDTSPSPKTIANYGWLRLFPRYLQHVSQWWKDNGRGMDALVRKNTVLVRDQLQAHCNCYFTVLEKIIGKQENTTTVLYKY